MSTATATYSVPARLSERRGLLHTSSVIEKWSSRILNTLRPFFNNFFVCNKPRRSILGLLPNLT
jgi:hypothetical protein